MKNSWYKTQRLQAITNKELEKFGFNFDKDKTFFKLVVTFNEKELDLPLTQEKIESQEVFQTVKNRAFKIFSEDSAILNINSVKFNEGYIPTSFVHVGIGTPSFISFLVFVQYDLDLQDFKDPEGIKESRFFDDHTLSLMELSDNLEKIDKYMSNPTEYKYLYNFKALSEDVREYIIDLKSYAEGLKLGKELRGVRKIRYVFSEDRTKIRQFCISDDNSNLCLSGESTFNKKYDSFLICLASVYDRKDSIVVTNEKTAVEFIKKYFKPEPKKIKVELKNKVYNDGSIKYKSVDDITSEILPDAKKRELYEKFKLEYNNVSDQVFLEAIRNIDLIDSIDEFYDKVMNAIPLGAIIQLASGCIIKHLPINELKRVVCDAVLSNITRQELGLLLDFLDGSLDSGASIIASEIRALDVEDDIGNTIIQLFANNLQYRDYLCFAVLASVPTAIYLLSKLTQEDIINYADEIVNPAKKLLEDLQDPAEELLEDLQEQLNSYSIFGMANNWRDAIGSLIDEFVQVFVFEASREIISEVISICEGSARSDFAGLPTNDPLNVPDNINGMLPAFPFMPFDFSDKIDLGALLFPFADLEPARLKKFLDDISRLITISELCALLSKDSSKANRDYVIQKIYFFLQTSEEYSDIRNALTSKSDIKQFFLSLGELVGQGYCVDILERQRATRKVLSDICNPNPTGALLEDLKEKAAGELLDRLVEEEKNTTKDLLANILDLLREKRKDDLFCGVLESQLHDSEKFVLKKNIDQTVTGLSKQFEQDLSFFKNVFLNPKDNYLKASENIKGALGSIYEPNVLNISSLSLSKEQLDGLVNENRLIAQKVNSTLINSNNAIEVVRESQNSVTIIANKSDDNISLNMNFDTAKLTIRIDDKEYTYNIDMKYYQALFVITDAFDTSSPYEKDLLFSFMSDVAAFGEVVKSIIVEHAEYITQQDLFKRPVFNNLKLTIADTKEICEESILFDFNTFETVMKNIKQLECSRSFSAIPSVSEVCVGHLLIETIFRIVLIEQLLKSVFTFASFNIDSLLPDLASIEKYQNNFYYNYILEQVENKINNNTLFQGVDFTFEEAIEKFSKELYEAKFKIQNSTTEEVIAWIFFTNFRTVRNKFSQRLLKSGLSTPAATLVDEYNFTQEQTDNQISKQVFDNLVAGMYDPPFVNSVSLQDKKILIPNGFYSNNPRLRNGGFILEKGYKANPIFNNADLLDVLNNSFLQNLLFYISNADGVKKDRGFEKLFNLVSLDIFNKGEASFEGFFGNYFVELNKEAFAIQATGISDQNKDIIKNIFNNIGNVSSTIYNFRYNLDLQETPLQTLKNYVEQQSKEMFVQQINYEESVLQELLDVLNNNLLKTRPYYSLNLMLLVPDDDNNILRQKYNEYVENTKGFNSQNITGFFESCIQKKFFIQEEGGRLYFKLPVTNMEFSSNLSESFNDIVFNSPVVLSQQDGRERVSTSDKFKTFIDNINYKELVSFLSLIVSEAVEDEYGVLGNLFDRTMTMSISSLAPIYYASNRASDREFYKKNNFLDSTNLQFGVDGADWVGLMFSSLVKSLATMVDPTWKTPWFAIGPLTPFGIVAKILDAAEDESSDNLNEALNSNSNNQECKKETN